jgi:type III secretion system YscD/HrpQ family protein
LQDATALMEYLAQNFPYNEKLENQVVVANNLEAEIQSLLTEKGFINVTFQLASGEIVLGGRVNDQSEKQFDLLVKDLKKMQGIRSVKNFVIMTTASTTRINLSEKYRITGTSKLGNVSQYVVINGQILTTGDLLDGMSITQIESDAVLLEKDGLKYRINYNQQ